jgi:hypothetical protein
MNIERREDFPKKEKFRVDQQCPQEQSFEMLYSLPELHSRPKDSVSRQACSLFNVQKKAYRIRNDGILVLDV